MLKKLYFYPKEINCLYVKKYTSDKKVDQPSRAASLHGFLLPELPVFRFNLHFVKEIPGFDK